MAASDKTSGQTVEIGQNLNLPQINALRNNLDQELSVLQDSLQSLKHAQQKFQQSSDCLENVSAEDDGKEILIPLTGSMYVPGKLSDPNSVIVNVGTGYYVEKDLDGARDYFKRKVEFVTGHMEKIQAIGLEKSRIRDALQDMSGKMMQQAQMAAGAKS